MQRICVTAFAALFMGLATIPLLKLYRQTFISPAEQQDSCARQIGDAIGMLNLYCVCDPPNCVPGWGRILVSDFPITRDRQEQFVLNRPDGAGWRGSVAIYVGRTALIQHNQDPARPDRSGVWAGAFVYGDPELIARLRAQAP